MNDDVTRRQIESCFVSVRNDAGDHVGGGVLVKHDTVITCAHVVSLAAGCDKASLVAPDKAVSVSFPLLEDRSARGATVKQFSPPHWPQIDSDAADVSVLTLQGALPEGALPQPLIQSGPIRNGNFAAFGITDSAPDGDWVDGELCGAVTGGAIQIKSDDQDLIVDEGFSGGPVWSSRHGGIVGIVVAIDFQAGRRRIAYSIPAETIARVVVDVPMALSKEPRLDYVARAVRELGSPASPATIDGVPFPLQLTYKPANDSHALQVRASELLKMIQEEGYVRLLITGSAGGGKSVAMVRLMDDLLTKGTMLPVLINLKSWKSSLSEALPAYHKGVSMAEIEGAVDIVLECSLPTDTTLDRLREATKGSEKTVFIVDALNEVGHEEKRRDIVQYLSDYVRRTLGTSVIVTSRTNRSVDGGNWREFVVQPVEVSEVEKILKDSGFSAERLSGLMTDERRLELLRIPFFLELGCKDQNRTFQTPSDALSDYFREHLNLSEDVLTNLAEAAYDAYIETRSTTFPLQAFIQSAGAAASSLDTLRESGDLREFKGANYPEQQAQFDHQLKHDFLAAFHMSARAKCSSAAGSADQWSSRALDSVTFGAESPDVLTMVVELLPPRLGTADRFIERVYDWNWPAAVTCLDVALEQTPHKVSAETKMALLALMAEKKLDRIAQSRDRATARLETLAYDDDAAEILAADGIADVYKLAKRVESKKEWYRAWLELFCAPGTRQSPTEADLTRIVERTSLIGWTAANALRRFEEIPDTFFLAIRTMYYAASGDAGEHRALRWRLVHALGQMPAHENVTLLREALLKDSYYWVRYGAARSLMEIACDSPDDLRTDILEFLTFSIRDRELKKGIVEEIGNALFIADADCAWPEATTSLRNSILEFLDGDEEKVQWEARFKTLTPVGGTQDDG